MSDNMYQLLAIVIYMVAMLAIGWYAFVKTSNLTDYMLGGRSLGPAVTALSAGAADMSGWLLMGLPGAIFLSGLVEAWIAIGLTIGAYLTGYLWHRVYGYIHRLQMIPLLFQVIWIIDYVIIQSLLGLLQVSSSSYSLHFMYRQGW